MTTERDLERTLERWLVDGSNEMPDRVFLAVLDQVDHQGQRPAWRLQGWQFLTMPTSARLAAIAVAVGIALLAGGILLAGRPAPEPPRTAIPPLLTIDAPPLPAGPLEPGSYMIQAGGAARAGIVIDVPRGWRGTGLPAITTQGTGPGPNGTALVFMLDPSVRDDPCAPWVPGDPWGSGSDEVVAGLEAIPGVTVSGVTRVELDGHRATRADLQLPAALPCATFVPFAGTDAFGAQGPSNRMRVWISDAGPDVVLIGLLDYAGTPTEDRAAAERIAETVRFVQPMALVNGPLDAGTYAARSYGFRADTAGDAAWRLTLPAGWSGIRDWLVYPTNLGPRGAPGATEPNGLGLVFLYDPAVALDSCDAAAGLSPRGSVDDLVAAIEARQDWVVSGPAAARIGGLDATRLEVELPSSLGGCEHAYRVLEEALDGGRGVLLDAQGPGNRLDLWIVDDEGQPFVVVRERFATTPADAIATSDAVLETLVITR